LNDGRRLVRNSILISGSVVAGGLLLFANLVLCARYLGVAHFGTFTLVITLVSLFQLFADGGVVNITIRDVARDSARGGEILGSTKTLVWAVTLGFALVLVAGSELLIFDPSVKVTVLLMGASALAALHASLHAGIMRAHEHMGMVAACSIVHKIGLLGLVWASIHADAGMAGVAFAHLAANVAQWVFQALWVRARYTRAKLRFDREHLRYLLKEAMPLGAAVVLRRFTVHLSTFLLTALSGVAAVGLYNAAYRFVQMIEIGAIALASVLFPALAKAQKASPERFARLYQDSLRVLIVISAPVGGALAALGDRYVLLLYGEGYDAAGSVLRILGVSLIFLVPGALAHPVLAALGRQTLFMRVALRGLVLNAGLGVLLIHFYASVGAAWVTLATEVFTFALGAWFIRSEKVVASYLGTFARAGLPAALLAVLLSRLAPSAGTVWLVVATVGYGVAYLVVVVALGAISLRELGGLLAPRKPGAGVAPTG
jgi:O-antigen/teichoic acid export membrane protein